MLGRNNALRQILQRSLATVLETFSDMEPRGGIFLCEPEGESLRLVAHQGLDPGFVRREERIRMGECLCGAVARTGEMVVSEQGCRDPRHTREPGQDHAHIIVPIKSRGSVLGVMFLYPTTRFSVKPSDVQMFDTIGAQLGMAVENLRLYGDVREAGAKFWDLFENARDILFTIDPNGSLTAVNRAMESFLGLTKRELVGRNVAEFFAGAGKEQTLRILAGELPLADRVYEFEVVKADGNRAFLEISGRSLFLQGRPVGFQMAARDVTEQKTLRELLVQAERLAAIGQIGIAMRHEINNPLTTVIGNAELLLERYESAGSDLKKRLELIVENSVRIANILKRLQDMKQDRTVEYVKGVKMTDLGPEGQGS
jgi:two-component system NtrC family sensor kinase